MKIIIIKITYNMYICMYVMSDKPWVAYIYLLEVFLTIATIIFFSAFLKRFEMKKNIL